MSALSALQLSEYQAAEETASAAGLAVSEAVYWEKYYNVPDRIYEWNNGYLEEKPVSDKLTVGMYDWFFKLLDHFLTVHPLGEKVHLETGFHLVLPQQTTVRRPDLGVILYSNPVPWLPSDNSYQGICDLCIEALSDSSRQATERDTVTKFGEYAASGVKEYYILYAKGEPMAFYRLNRWGVYVPIKPIGRDLIRSTVLPGFQFRTSDLYHQPSAERMSRDIVYKGFMLPALQEARRQAAAAEQRAEEAEQRAEEAEQRAEEAKQRAVREAQRAAAVEVEIARLKGLLAKNHKKRS
jgi:hypothetical protein